jgi:hypothetical protein
MGLRIYPFGIKGELDGLTVLRAANIPAASQILGWIRKPDGAA